MESQISQLQWLYDDAVFMNEQRRQKGALLLLLCLIDALSIHHNPNEINNRKRYSAYLNQKLREIGQERSIRVEEKKELVPMGDIIYEYFRCYFVHEGDSRENSSYEVQIEYNDSGRFRFNAGILMDRVRKQIVIKSKWLIEVLMTIANNELTA